jgi:hypothetical protein
MPPQSSGTTNILVSVNGDQVSGLLRASIATTNCFAADTYSITFAIESPGDTSFWSMIPSAYLEVTAVMPFTSGGYQSLITGMADTIHVDPIQGTVGVEGRDLSSSMIDSYRQQDFVNRSASEIVSAIAQYHNLQPVVTPTDGNIGRYYSDGYTKISLGQFSRLQSDWDLVVQLARESNFDVFVEGRLLYFRASGASAGAPICISLRDVQSARVEKNLSITRNATVSVQSWNSQNMAAYQSDGPGEDAIKVQGSSIVGLPFLFSGANYTPQQATDWARRYEAELSRLGTVLNLDMPWDLSLRPRATILLNGTNSLFDTTYLIDSIERHFSPTSGSRQLVRAVQV